MLVSVSSPHCVELSNNNQSLIQSVNDREAHKSNVGNDEMSQCFNQVMDVDVGYTRNNGLHKKSQHSDKLSSLNNVTFHDSNQYEMNQNPDCSLNVLFWNIQGIGSKLELNSIRKLFSNFDLIFIFETMKLDNFNPSMPNYEFIHCQRQYKHPKARRPSGGIAVLIKDKIKHLIKVEKQNEHVIWISVKQKHHPSLIIGGTYIPPAGSQVYLNSRVNDIFQALQEDIAHFLLSTPSVALCGDFNSRTGGLSDRAVNVNGKDNDLIANLDDVFALHHNEQDKDWYNKERQMKDQGQNQFGKELTQMCKNSSMRILNGFLYSNNTDDFTCHAPLGRSTVDYLLSTQKFAEAISNFNISPKLVESDHVPLTFSVNYRVLHNDSRPNKAKSNISHKRFQYVFEKDKVLQYKAMLKEDVAQDRLIDLTNYLSSDASVDSIIQSTYDYVGGCIEKTFKRKQFKSVQNTFPTNKWYDQECKQARKNANDFAKSHDLKSEVYNLEYKVLYKRYKYTIQRKKRLYQKANRDKLEKLRSTNQTECWRVWNDLTNTKIKISKQPDIDTFHEYFTKQVYPPTCSHFDQDHMLEINNKISQIMLFDEVSDTIGIKICDSQITESEVALHLKKLKNNKAAGLDGISGDFYKCVADEMTVPFCAIFNYIFNKGEYPSQWAEGLINALHKKGDFSNPDNYRKITITVAMAKVFDSILNARLYFKNEALDIDDPFQFGFTPCRGTSDCVFVLDTVISHQRFKKKPTYLCFVDFTKAFDYINRNALYYKLSKKGMGLKMLKMIISMFEKAQAKVHQQGSLSASIDSVFGVLQGGILSPKLFNEFLSDLPGYLNNSDGICIDNTPFTHLLYADDVVLISESAKGLQNSIDKLHTFCSEWHLIVNTSKTKVMQFGVKDQTCFLYNKQGIENVNMFKYLGHTISTHRNMHKMMPDYLATQAQKALFALSGRMKPSLGHISPSLAIKMFDSYVLPVLEYNSMFWSRTTEIPKIEKVQVGYLKHILNVRRQTPTLAVYAETGRFPLLLRQQMNTVNYWAKLKKLPNYDILNKCLQILEKLHNKGQNNWFSKIGQIMAGANIPEWVSGEPGLIAKDVKLKLYAKEQIKILNEINDSDKHPKLRTYKLFKTNFCLEPYLNLNLPKKMYGNIARFRLSSHNLKIETGRHSIPKIPKELRRCDKCNTGDIEDEIHCLLICTNNTVPRTDLLSVTSGKISDSYQLNKTQQFIALMSDKRPEMIQAIGSYLNKVMS